MKTKNGFLVFFLMGVPFAVSAQPAELYAPQSVPPPMPPAGRIEQVTTVNGAVTEWTYNDDFEYDGLYLNTGSATLFVKFPPHLGQQVRALGKNLSVSGVLRYNPEGVQELKMVSMSGNGQTVYDQPPIPGAAPIQEQYVNGEGKVSQMQINKRGDVVGYILENGVILRIPPHIARQFPQIVQTGSVIGYTGFEKVLKTGHVRAYNYKIIRCQTISINGTQYLVR